MLVQHCVDANETLSNLILELLERKIDFEVDVLVDREMFAKIFEVFDSRFVLVVSAAAN